MPAQWVAAAIPDAQKTKNIYIYGKIIFGKGGEDPLTHRETAPRTVVHQVIGDVSISGIKSLVKLS